MQFKQFELPNILQTLRDRFNVWVPLQTPIDPYSARVAFQNQDCPPKVVISVHD